MKTNYAKTQSDYGLKPYVTNVMNKTIQNKNYRTALWTGCHTQMTLMCIPVCSDIGLELHEDTEQIIRIEQGMALVKMGDCENQLNFQVKACVGDTIFVPAKTWHNIINIGRIPLKLSSIYAPPHHPAGTIQHTREDAEKSNY
ncbi:MAG: cupin domain-containing protein [Lachnospira sp.]|nr:cupin domain-containing protein [Lachnospira sp.]